MSVSPVSESPVSLSEDERLDWLQLARSENVGPAAFRSMIETFGSAAEAIDAAPSLARKGGAAARITIADRAMVGAELEAADRLGVALVGLFEPDYPELLRQIDGAPPMISVLGARAFFDRPAISIVGSRNASAAGRKLAATLARDLGAADLSVVSGLARGIDTSAHQASLATGTIAVFAGGLDHIYPPENAGLVEDIVAGGGAAISEMPLGWRPRGRDFPRRNRIIAGLGLATIVVEAAERSGSLITARMALEQNREVMAVPGSPLDPRANGTNRLIKAGAALVETAEDVLQILRPMVGHGFTAPTPSAIEPIESAGTATGSLEISDKDRDLISQALGPSPIDIDEIIRATGLPARTVTARLLELELAGRLERHPGSRVSLRS